MDIKEKVNKFLESDDVTFEGDGYNLIKMTLDEAAVKEQEDLGHSLVLVDESKMSYVVCVESKKEEEDEIESDAKDTAKTDENPKAKNSKEAEKEKSDKKELKEQIAQSLILKGADKVTAVLEAGNILREGYVGLEEAIAKKAADLNITPLIIEFHENCEGMEALFDDFDVEKTDEYFSFKYREEDLDKIQEMVGDVSDLQTRVGVKSFRRVMEESGFEADAIKDIKAVFEAAVSDRVAVIEKDAEKSLAEKIETVVEAMVNVIDEAAETAIDDWIAAHEEKLVESIKLSKAQTFIENVKTLFAENNLSIDEATEDDLENALKTIENLKEEKETLKENQKTLVSHLEGLGKEKEIGNICEKHNLTFSQKERLIALSENVQFDEEFSENIDIIAKAHFVTNEQSDPYESVTSNETVTDGIVVEKKMTFSDDVTQVLNQMNVKTV